MDKIKCKKIDIPKDVCYLRFKEDKTKHSEDIGYSNRGEQMIVDYNDKEEIIGIELIDSDEAKKPCMRSG